MTKRTFIRCVVVLGLATGIASIAVQSIAPYTYGQASRLNVVVLCASCALGSPEMRNTGPFLLDQNNGAVWFYPGGLESQKAPVYLGKLTELGKPLTK